MHITEATKILKEHNEWRRDNSFSMDSKMISPKVLGNAIDTVISYLENLSLATKTNKGCNSCKKGKPCKKQLNK